MRLLNSLADAFIRTFGITQPDEEARRRASWFIVGLLVLSLVAVSIVGTVIFRMIRV